ncbi:MAG: chromate transporter [Burkholderiaceae bacterium]
MNLETWLALFGHFVLLSFLSIGGAIAVVPDMHRYLVGSTGLLTDPQFNASIAIAQASPGPNVLFVAVMGWQAAGWMGAAATLLGIMLPSTVLTIGVAHWAQTRSHWLPLRAFRAGMAPITIALLAATGAILIGDAPDWRVAAVAAVTAVLVWRTRIHMLWLIAAGGLLGALGLV